VRRAPVRQTPAHAPFSHANSPIADPSEVPVKLTVIYTVFSRFRAAGINAVTTYGMSETCGGCVYDGVPLDGVRVRADDEGRLRISGPVLMNRYHGRPDLTREALDGGEFVTSDLGSVADDGRASPSPRASAARSPATNPATAAGAASGPIAA